MASIPHNEKTEVGTTGSDSTAYTSDNERIELQKPHEAATGYPDSDHEEVEAMDAGHMRDLERQLVRTLSLYRLKQLLISFRL